MIADVVTEEVKNTAEPYPEDIATADFQVLLPQFNRKLEECSNRQLKRVVAALLEWPFQEKDPRLPYLQERQLYALGVGLLKCKHVIMQSALMLKADQLKKLMELEGEKNEEIVQA